MLTLVPTPPLFDTDVAAASVHFDPGLWSDANARTVGVVLPAELARAAHRRKAEYVAGRYCAGQALALLSGGAIEGMTGLVRHVPKGPPVWPEGVKGSITHSRGFASSAVGRAECILGIGVDSERIIEPRQLQSIETEICRWERRLIPMAGLSPALHSSIVFSAKESLFKCLFPLTGQMFWFTDVFVDVGPGDRFEAVLLSDVGGHFRRGWRISGRYVVSLPFVHTGILLRRDDML
jgi:enterobactin synthetase component D